VSLTMHTGQIAEYIKFDEKLRTQGRFSSSTPVPSDVTASA
jgi:hypothetical protein